MSSAYHPEADGQIEVLNRCVETYLRCFTANRPKGWNKWLTWAEYCYNTGFQSTVRGTPFEVVYGHPLLSLHQFLPCEIRVQALAEDLRDRDEILQHLHF